MAASAIVVAAVLQLAAAVATAIDLEHPPSQLSGFRYRLLLVAQGVNAFTAVLLVIAVAFVALFDFFVEDGDTRAKPVAPRLCHSQATRDIEFDRCSATSQP